MKLHHSDIFGDQQGEKKNLISLGLFAYIFLADVFGVLFYDNGLVTLTFLFTSWDLPPSLQERLATQPRCSEVYINSISPYCKAQLTLFRILFFFSRVITKNYFEYELTHVDHLLTMKTFIKKKGQRSQRCLLESYHQLSIHLENVSLNQLTLK